MQIIVSKDNVKIEKFDTVHEGEYRINKCSFSFSEEYTADLVKKAIFGTSFKAYEVPIINNECDIPAEVLNKRQQVILGVYAYAVEEDELKLRYSPSYTVFSVISGSYQEASESEEISPSQFEIYMQALQNGLNKVDTVISEVNQATDDAKDLVSEINQKLENGDFVGQEGPQGPQGLPGKDGRDGVGITTITSGQPTIEEDKTITTVMVNKTDGSSESFSIEAQNGQNGSDGANGENGLTPEIGANGNWFLGGTDTGKPSRGEPGESPDLSDYVQFEKLDNIIPKNEVTDEVVSIDDAVDYKVFETVVEGASEQMTTSGKNLLPNNLKSQTKNGLTITINNDKSITINGTATDYINLPFVENFTLPKGNYILSYHSKNLPTTGDIFTVSVDEKGVDRFGFSLAYNYSDTFEEDTIFSEIGFAINGGTVFNNTTFYPMIEKGTTVTEYEVFTGGQPSPNPEYPQEIITLSFDKITSCGKNSYYGIADKYSFSVNSSSWYDVAGNSGIQGTNVGTKTIYKASVEKGKTYTAMATVTGSNITNMSLIYDDETTIYSLGNVWTSPYTFEAKKDGYVLFRFWINSPSSIEVSNVQLERGSTATSYEPYQGQDFVIDLKENEMVEIPNGVKDELVIDEKGNVNLIKKIGNILLDGSIDFYPFIEGSENGINNYGNVLFANYDILKEKPAVSPYNKYPTVISDYFKEIDGNIWIGDKIAIDVNNYQVILTVPQNLATTTEELKEWLSIHNTTLYYELKEPQTINLGKITNLTTREGTNTFFKNGNISSKIRIKYALDTKKYIDKKIAEISSAIIKEG